MAGGDHAVFAVFRRDHRAACIVFLKRPRSGPPRSLSAGARNTVLGWPPNLVFDC
jgi:hypothetical protein